MPTTAPRSPWSDPLVKWFVGFFGGFLGVLLLPKTLKYLIKNFVFGVLGEVVIVLVTGLLSEKVVDLLNDHTPRQATPRK